MVLDMNIDENNMDASHEQTLEERSQNRRYNKRILTFSGLFLSIMTIAISVAQILTIAISEKYIKVFYESDWFDVALTAIGVVGVGLPLFAILMKKVPSSEKGKVNKLSFGRFVGYFFVSIATLYISNTISVIINLFIGIMRGKLIDNPVQDIVFNGNLLVNLLYICLFGPIVEELIFRKILLDKLRRFGNLPAILLTGIAFGLSHMNLSQFFYATTLGILFAYITIRTNTVIYTMILHIMINFIGSGLPLLILKWDLISLEAFTLWTYASMIIGTVILILNIKKIKINKVKMPLVNKWDYILNPGTLMFLFISLGMIALSLL